MLRRHRPLNVCGSSISRISQNVYKDVKNSQGTLGTMVTRMDPFFAYFSTSPVVNAIENQSKSALNYADDRILEFESKMETAFPTSTLAFDAVDEVLDVVETLPTKLDGVYRSNFPYGLTLTQFARWVYAFLISLLKFCISILTHGGLPEKEIMVDITYNVTRPSSKSSILSQSNSLTNRLGWMKCSYKDILKKPEKVVKCSYKDILQRGTKNDHHPNTTDTKASENIEDTKMWEIGRIKDDHDNEYIIVKAGEREKEEDGEDTPKDPLGGIRIKGDPTLFDTSWHIKSRK